MPEMTPMEIAEGLKKIENRAPRLNGLTGYDITVLWNAQNAMRKIASGEYAEVVRVEPMKIKPTDTKALFERQCPKCDSLLFATDNFCGYCGAVIERDEDDV